MLHISLAREVRIELVHVGDILGTCEPFFFLSHMKPGLQLLHPNVQWIKIYTEPAHTHVKGLILTLSGAAAESHGSHVPGEQGLCGDLSSRPLRKTVWSYGKMWIDSLKCKREISEAAICP